MSGSTDRERIRMDHVALASRHTWDQVTRYCHQLGGRWLGGPPLDGRSFYFCQVEFAGGTKLELLEPIPGEGSDFLRRFLDRNGPGPHHFTFKVPDFEAALRAVAAAGHDLVGVERSNPDGTRPSCIPSRATASSSNSPTKVATVLAGPRTRSCHRRDAPTRQP